MLTNSGIALVEDWATRDMPLKKGPEDYSPETQICFPYRGVFIWHVGGEDIVGDANQILFVAPGEAFKLSHPHSEGCGEMIVTPRPDVIAEFVERPCAHPLFRRRSRHADPGIQRGIASFRQRVCSGELDEFAADELLLELVVAALQWCHRDDPVHPGTRRLVDRAKVFLGANSGRTVRLKDIASAVGGSPSLLD